MANRIDMRGVKVTIGDTIRVFYKIIEKEAKAGKTKKEVKQEVRERIQPFEGVLISIKGVGDNRSFMVRRIGAASIGIERIFPVISPWIEKVEIVKTGRVRQAKPYYLRDAKRFRRIDTGEIKNAQTVKQPSKS